MKQFELKYGCNPNQKPAHLDLVIEECNKKGMVMAFTGMRLFHH